MPRIYCCQHSIQWETPTATCAHVSEMLAHEHPDPASLVLLPEMFATGFSMNLACADHGDTQRFLSQTASALGIYLQAGITLLDPSGRGKNMSLTYDPSGICIAHYVKLHPFSFGTENQFFTAGQTIECFDWQGFRTAPFICYDLRFPEVFRTAALSGANLLTVIANWPAQREAHWRTLLAARAIENQSYVAAVNRVGTDPNATYAGASLIIDPTGKILADAGDKECLIHADISPAVTTTWRNHFPALQDLHPNYRTALQAPGSARGYQQRPPQKPPAPL